MQAPGELARRCPIDPRRDPPASAPASIGGAGGIALTIQPLSGIPEVTRGDDLASLIGTAMELSGWRTQPKDVIVVAHKVVSKAEGRTRPLADVKPSDRATSLARELDRDPRLVQLVLDGSREILRSERVLICETHSGHVCANAGVDMSNAPDGETAVLLPEDPDESARRLRSRLADRLECRPAVVITDSFGRPWRLGQTDVALGCAGLRPTDDWRGRTDSRGRPLRATVVAVADELAAAADLARSKDGNAPAVAVRGLDRFVTEEDGPGSRSLMRPRTEDLFR